MRDNNVAFVQVRVPFDNGSRTVDLTVRMHHRNIAGGSEGVAMRAHQQAVGNIIRALEAAGIGLDEAIEFTEEA